jgi:hypothetical protein
MPGPVPLEYSVGSLSCAVAGRLGMVMAGWAGAGQDRLRAGLPIADLTVCCPRGDLVAAAEALVRQILTAGRPERPRWFSPDSSL